VTQHARPSRPPEPPVRDGAPLTLRRDEVSDALAGFEARRAERADRQRRRPAAVAVTLVGDPATDVLITRRAPTLRAHSGQWALPGGRVDEGETVPAAALRELSEEIGLDLPESALLGRLDDYATRSGFVMSAVVLWAGPVGARAGRPLRPNRDEVAAVYGIPLHQLDVDPILLTIPESDAPVIRIPLMGRFLHAPTAAVLHQFREVVLHRRPTRVAHFEQPVFAWK
jgi:8-oxo-dGTP pyrophosphatase MutT (NUDIX family)